MRLKTSLSRRLKTLIIGDARSPHDRTIFHKLSLIAFFAWVGLGSDGLSSSCYGPEEAFRALQAYPYLGIFVALGSVLTIFVISASYSQIIELFPSGGGGRREGNDAAEPREVDHTDEGRSGSSLFPITVSVAS